MGPLITICARGGSQGVKRKNVRELMGKPLIAHTIDAALAWGKAERVVVSTDSDEIAAVARSFGAEVPFRRPLELAAGEVPKMAVIRHAVQELEAGGGRYDVVIDLDVTAPLRHVSDIENAYSLFLERRPLTVFSVVRSHANPYYNLVETDWQGLARLSKDWNDEITSRQMAPAVYQMNGSIHIYSRAYLMDERNWHVCSRKSCVYVMDDVTGIDIDREIDFQMVEFLVERGVFAL